MGRAKQLLAVNGRPMLAAVTESIIAGGVSAVVVVTRSEIAAALADVLPRLAVVMRNDDPTTEMIHSIRLGLAATTSMPLAAGDGIMVVPGDQPGISPACIRRCADEFRAHCTDLVIAAWRGRPGHPLIFPADLLSFVQSPECDRGLRALPKAFPHRVRMIESDTPAVIRDVDTAADYHAMLREAAEG